MAKYSIFLHQMHENSAISKIWNATTDTICRKDQLRDTIDIILDELIPDNIADMPELHNDLPVQVDLIVKKSNGTSYQVIISKLEEV